MSALDGGIRETITREQLPLEFVMNHLRLKDGFSLTHYQAVTGLSIETLQPALKACIDQGLLLACDDRVSCSPRGWDFLDEILEKFMP